MLNQVVIVGKIENIIDDFIKLSVKRAYKNSNGIYESDVISCKLSENLCNDIKEKFKVGDLAGIKGRIETFENQIVVVIDKITYLSKEVFCNE